MKKLFMQSSNIYNLVSYYRRSA